MTDDWGYFFMRLENLSIFWEAIQQLFEVASGCDSPLLSSVLGNGNMGYERIESSAILSYEDFCIGRIGWDLWDKKHPSSGHGTAWETEGDFEDWRFLIHLLQ